MRSAPYIPSMVQAITVLTVLKMMTKAQTSCGQGVGRTLYERLPNHQLQGFDDDVVRDTAPPFSVLEKCQDLCLRDRTSGNNIVRTCTSFDFQPGSRIASFSGTPEYEESTCYLTREQAQPEGIGNLMLVPNSVHFTEVCVSSNRPDRECPNRRYIFERHPRKKLKLSSEDLKEMSASNRTECEERCLNEFSFVCRSATFDQAMRTCMLSRFTRRTHPELLADDPNSDYLENTCLNAERRCDGLAVFIKEENKRLGGPFEVDLYTNLTLEECQSLCLRAEKYFCRSIEFDEMTKQCTLSEEDSYSQKDDLGIASSPTHHFYDLVCLDNPRGSEYPDNSATSHLFSTGRRPDTAFQRYRNSRLGGEFHSEITGRTLSECLDECLRQTSFQCMSAVYSDRFRTCRLSRFNTRNGMRIIYDADYDYYENLMPVGDGEGSSGSGGPGGRPDPMGQDSGYYGHNGKPGYYPPSSGGSDRYPSGGGRYPPGDRDRDRDRDRYPSGDKDRYPGGDRDRYPSSGGGRYPIDNRYPSTDTRYPSTDTRYPSTDTRYPSTDRYPSTGDRYPSDRYPPGGGRYPSEGGRYPYDRYPGTDRYPVGGGERYPPGSGDRYPPAGDRYPPTDRFPSDRYPTPPDRYPAGDRYPPPTPVDRYPTGDRYPPPTDRYPPPTDKYPPTRYPSSSGRYPSDRYPPSSSGPRYPPSSSGGRYPESGGRYPESGGRYPDAGTSGRYPESGTGGRYPESGTGGRYPDAGSGGRFPPSSSGGRYPPSSSGGRYPPSSSGGDRYPAGERYPSGDRYPMGSKYPIDRYPPSSSGSRYPPRYPDDRYPSKPDRYPTGDRFQGNGISDDRWYYTGRRPNYSPARPLPPVGPGALPQGPGYQDGFGYSSFGGVGPGRPFSSRCDEGENFKQAGVRQRVRKQFVRRFVNSGSLSQCQRECVEARDFICRSFNYREPGPPYDGPGDRDNCELSDRDSRDLDLNNPAFFDTTGNYDFYERSAARDGIEGECLDGNNNYF